MSFRVFSLILGGSNGRVSSDVIVMSLQSYRYGIEEIWEAERKYDPDVYGLRWDKENLRVQIESIGTRGYIELLAVK